MRLSLGLLAQSARRATRSVGAPETSPLSHKRAGSNDFDSNFVTPAAPRKPWHGQDKDEYYRKKYSHVHARQMKEEKPEPKASPYKRARSFTKNKTARYDSAVKEGRTPRKEPNVIFQRQEMYEREARLEALSNTFARRHATSLEQDPRRDFVFGSGPVLAALQAQKRQLLSLHTGLPYGKASPEIIAACSKLELDVAYDVPMQHLNIMTNNAVHNRYVLEARPLEQRHVSSLGPLVPDAALLVNEIVQGDIIETPLPVVAAKKHPLVLYIDEVTDAHNMGAIIRSAFYLGVDCLVHSAKNSARLSPVVDKTSAGALEHMTIFDAPQPLKFFEETRANGWSIVATSPKPAKDLAAIAPSGLKGLLELGPCMLVVGSEGEGLRTSLLQRSTHAVTWNGLQDKSRLDSLNVSVAASLLLSQFHADGAFD